MAVSNAELACAADWWKTFHVPEMADMFLDARSPEVLQQTTSFLIRELQLKPGEHVYDQCCGSGSLANALAKEGMILTGADLCEIYIERAKVAAAVDETAFANFCKPEFFCDDAFQFLPSSTCAGVFNWYSSFGYSSDDACNLQMLQRAYDALRPGGRFALDVLHLPFVLRNFRPEMKHEGTANGRRVMLNRTSEIDLTHGLLRQTWTWQIEGMSAVERLSAMRLYLPHQIRNMLMKCGFQHIQLMGDLLSSPLQIDSSRLIITAQRPSS